MNRTPRQMRALRMLHRSRRGRRLHPSCPDVARLGDAIARIRSTFGATNQYRQSPLSLTAAAKQIGVDLRTLRRWLRGKHHPSPKHHPSLKRVVRRARELAP